MEFKEFGERRAESGLKHSGNVKRIKHTRKGKDKFHPTCHQITRKPFSQHILTTYCMEGL
jgi:hypothetical protein